MADAAAAGTGAVLNGGGHLRVVSLLPSATETLCLVGAGHMIVARSHECDFPASLAPLPALTKAENAFVDSRQMHEAVAESLGRGRGLYHLDGQLLEALRPDLIVAQSLCSVCAVDMDLVTAAAAALDPPPAVVSLNPHSLADVVNDCRRVGEAVGRATAGAEAADALQQRIDAARAAAKQLAGAQPIKVRGEGTQYNVSTQ